MTKLLKYLIIKLIIVIIFISNNYAWWRSGQIGPHTYVVFDCHSYYWMYAVVVVEAPFVVEDSSSPPPPEEIHVYDNVTDTHIVSIMYNIDDG